MVVLPGSSPPALRAALPEFCRTAIRHWSCRVRRGIEPAAWLCRLRQEAARERSMAREGGMTRKIAMIHWRSLGTVLAVSLVAGWLVPAAPAFAEKRVALVIGNNHCKNVPKLQKAVNFDPEAALIHDQRKILDMTATSWLSFRECNGLLVYYTPLMSYRCAIREVRVGIDSAVPDRVLKMPPCDLRDPRAIPLARSLI